jgi:hypothetical protein
MTPENTRVGAIRNEADGTVYFFGYGVYVGRKSCPLLDGFDNPKIELDGGGTVWGCESWWGPEEKIKQMIGEKQVVMVDPSARDMP